VSSTSGTVCNKCDKNIDITIQANVFLRVKKSESSAEVVYYAYIVPYETKLWGFSEFELADLSKPLNAILIEPGQALNKSVYAFRHAKGQQIAVNSRHFRLFDYKVCTQFFLDIARVLPDNEGAILKYVS
jgi:hypothetical protein